LRHLEHLGLCNVDCVCRDGTLESAQLVTSFTVKFVDVGGYCSWRRRWCRRCV